MSSYYKRITDQLAEDRENRRKHVPRAERRTQDFGKIAKRVSLLAGLVIVIALAVLYVGDSALLRYRVSAQKNAFGEITVHPYYAMHLKNGRTEFSFQPDEQERCVNSLFPHLGMTPCWYLSRHPDKRTDI